MLELVSITTTTEPSRLFTISNDELTPWTEERQILCAVPPPRSGSGAVLFINPRAPIIPFFSGPLIVDREKDPGWFVVARGGCWLG